MSKIGFIFHKMLKKIAKAEHHLDFIKRSVLNLRIPKGFIINFSPSAMSFGDIRTTPLNQVCMESSFKIMIATYKHTKTVLVQLIAELNLKITNISASHPNDFDRVFADAQKSKEKTVRQLRTLMFKKLDRDLRYSIYILPLDFRRYFINLHYFDMKDWFSTDFFNVNDNFNNVNNVYSLVILITNLCHPKVL